LAAAFGALGAGALAGGFFAGATFAGDGAALRPGTVADQCGTLGTGAGADAVAGRDDGALDAPNAALGASNARAGVGEYAEITAAMQPTASTSRGAPTLRSRPCRRVPLESMCRETILLVIGRSADPHEPSFGYAMRSVLPRRRKFSLFHVKAVYLFRYAGRPNRPQTLGASECDASRGRWSARSTQPCHARVKVRPRAASMT
jgi:hypothetical protein